MAQPQFFFVDNYTDKSFLVRSNPEDALKPYSSMMTPFLGKWGRGYGGTSPQDPVKSSAWVFSKKHEVPVKQLIAQIQAGTVVPPQVGPTSDLTLSRSVLPIIGGSFPPINSQLEMVFGEQKIPVVIESVDRSANNFVVSATIRLPDGQRARIELETKPVWKIPGFNQPHSVTLL